jgi:hypothetical protein
MIKFEKEITKFVLAFVLIATLAVLAVNAYAQACNPNERVPPQCYAGYHPVAHCVCDAPSGPCHWVWACERN